MVVFDITMIAVTLIAVIGAVLTAKVFLGHQGTGSKYLKVKMKEMEDVIDFQKKQVTRYKNKASQIEVGPSFEESEGGLSDILPDVISEFGNFLPKWAQPFMKDPEMMKYAIEYAGKHPDIAKKWFGKIMGKKKNEDNTETSQQTQSL